ncbi:PPOX class probable F420-dependent enzyme [Frankia sp. EI5c]|uniref:PPOX class F420-dependent oxidoreductase n=1 Tax=Frankia sp. EI5c TaxID=683316 RepID=UPI0007C318C6|nr:PPOX class F420-dependent oxidoreductase [Frankia sp. EI5c]OAA21854.1 PPOX class probable F420-dependent enzyme [Frankia sp. EI5c]
MSPSAARDLSVDRTALLEFIRSRHHGILITTRRDGRPQASPVSVGVDAAGDIVVSSYPERAKTRNARRDERASVCVLSDDFNGDWVQVDGTITVVDQPAAVEQLVEYYRCISGEHPDWDEYRAAMRRQGKVLLRLRIERWGPISRGGFPPHLLAGRS